MKKINTIGQSLGNSVDILTAKQMSNVRGGTGTLTDVLTSGVEAAAAAVGPISATDDDKRRDRPGGGISTH